MSSSDCRSGSETPLDSASNLQSQAAGKLDFNLTFNKAGNILIPRDEALYTESLKTFSESEEIIELRKQLKQAKCEIDKLKALSKQKDEHFALRTKDLVDSEENLRKMNESLISALKLMESPDASLLKKALADLEKVSENHWRVVGDLKKELREEKAKRAQEKKGIKEEMKRREERLKSLETSDKKNNVVLRAKLEEEREENAKLRREIIRIKEQMRMEKNQEQITWTIPTTGNRERTKVEEDCEEVGSIERNKERGDPARMTEKSANWTTLSNSKQMRLGRSPKKLEYDSMEVEMEASFSPKKRQEAIVEIEGLFQKKETIGIAENDWRNDQMDFMKKANSEFVDKNQEETSDKTIQEMEKRLNENRKRFLSEETSAIPKKEKETRKKTRENSMTPPLNEKRQPKSHPEAFEGESNRKPIKSQKERPIQLPLPTGTQLSTEELYCLNGTQELSSEEESRIQQMRVAPNQSKSSNRDRNHYQSLQHPEKQQMSLSRPKEKGTGATSSVGNSQSRIEKDTGQNWSKDSFSKEQIRPNEKRQMIHSRIQTFGKDHQDLKRTGQPKQSNHPKGKEESFVASNFKSQERDWDQLRNIESQMEDDSKREREPMSISTKNRMKASIFEQNRMSEVKERERTRTIQDPKAKGFQSFQYGQSQTTKYSDRPHVCQSIERIEEDQPKVRRAPVAKSNNAAFEESFVEKGPRRTQSNELRSDSHNLSCLDTSQVSFQRKQNSLNERKGGPDMAQKGRESIGSSGNPLEERLTDMEFKIKSMSIRNEGMEVDKDKISLELQDFKSKVTPNLHSLALASGSLRETTGRSTDFKRVPQEIEGLLKSTEISKITLNGPRSRKSSLKSQNAPSPSQKMNRNKGENTPSNFSRFESEELEPQRDLRKTKEMLGKGPQNGWVQSGSSYENSSSFRTNCGAHQKEESKWEKTINQPQFHYKTEPIETFGSLEEKRIPKGTRNTSNQRNNNSGSFPKKDNSSFRQKDTGVVIPADQVSESSSKGDLLNKSKGGPSYSLVSNKAKGVSGLTRKLNFQL